MAFRTNKTPVLQTKSASGAVASFNTALAMPLASCTSLITGYQEGSGTPSPDNVRPLHAFSSASLGKCDNNTASLWTIDNSFNGDVAFNQLAQNGNFADASGYIAQTGCTINSISDNVANVSFAGGNNAQLAHDVSLTNWHKFLSMIDIKLANESDSLRFSGGSYTKTTGTVATTEWQTLSLMFNSTYSYWIVRNTTANDVNNAQLRNAVVFDLTVMFGSTIADYIYNLETQTAGAGVVFFKALYPNDYYPYNAGTKQLVGDTLATFTFGQDIYQGSIDWLRGVVAATWGYIASYNGETLTGEWLSDKAPYEAGTTPPTGSQVAYELSTPIEIPLGGINLLTQEGQNNIFADCGDIDLTYKDLDIAKRGNFREVFKLPS